LTAIAGMAMQRPLPLQVQQRDPIDDSRKHRGRHGGARRLDNVGIFGLKRTQT